MLDYEASGVVKNTWSLEAKYDVRVLTLRFERPALCLTVFKVLPKVRFVRPVSSLQDDIAKIFSCMSESLQYPG